MGDHIAHKLWAIISGASRWFHTNFTVETLGERIRRENEALVALVEHLRQTSVPATMPQTDTTPQATEVLFAYRPRIGPIGGMRRRHSLGPYETLVEAVRTQVCDPTSLCQVEVIRSELWLSNGDLALYNHETYGRFRCAVPSKLRICWAVVEYDQEWLFLGGHGHDTGWETWVEMAAQFTSW